MTDTRYIMHLVNRPTDNRHDNDRESERNLAVVVKEIIDDYPPSLEREKFKRSAKRARASTDERENE